MAELRQKENIHFDYDDDADVMYVSFGTNEPSHSEHVNDFVLLDIGLFTGLPTGFSILHCKELKEEEFKSFLGDIREMVQQQLMKKAEKRFHQKVQASNRIFNRALKEARDEKKELVEA